MTGVGDGLIGLLVPFLVIGTVALLVAVMTLRARRRSILRMRATPTPRPECEWPGVPAVADPPQSAARSNGA